MAIKIISLLLGGLLVLGCSTGPCRTKNLSKANEKMGEIEKIETVKVYKYDGTLQCGMGERISPELMQKDLKDIKVLSVHRKNDGLMRIQLCGSPTGDANVFEILKVDMEKAMALGFKPWTFD